MNPIVAVNSAFIHRFTAATMAATRPHVRLPPISFPRSAQLARASHVHGHTDGKWKQNLYAAAKQLPPANTGSCMEPFKANRPYFVGSYGQAGELLAKLVRKGVRRIIIDFPRKEEGYEHTGKALQAAQAMLG